MLQPSDSQTATAQPSPPHDANAATHDSVPVYHDSRQHLFEELRRLDLLLNLHIARRRRDAARAGFDEFRGLFISEDEIDILLARQHQHHDEPQSDAPDANNNDAETAVLAATIEHLEKQIAAKTAASLRQGIRLPLQTLRGLFQLSRFDVDALLVCVAVELDLKYEKLYAYLQDDVTRKRPSANLMLELFCPTLADKLQARQRLSGDAPLFHNQLMRHADEAHGEQAPFLSRPLKIDERILQFLLDADTLDAPLAAFTTLTKPRATLTQLLLPTETKTSLERIFHSYIAPLLPGSIASTSHERIAASLSDGRAGARVFILEGAAGVGKNTTAEALCASAGIELLLASVPVLVANVASLASNLKRLFREAQLRGAAIYFDHAESLVPVENEKETHARATLFKELREFRGIAFVGSEQPLNQNLDAPSEAFIRVSFPVPDYSLRRQLWQTFCADSDLRVAADVEHEALADKFVFTAGKIRGAIDEARHHAMLRDGDAYEISNEDLYRACRSQSSQRLAGLAKKITPLYTWHDIVLPGNRLMHLKEVCAHVKHRQRVFGEWGFDRKIALGKGLGILFVGASGTGKTMAAEIVAGELGLDLYKIDLSSVVSKYIGETEKNLSRIFEEAEQSNAVLFFDEADAIFGKRSEVKDSHDRYANIETNYLLQRMEEHEGIVILASNFQKNIDDAFTRRIRFIIDFPFPDDAYRYHIWKKVFPEDTPLHADIDFDFLAQKLKLTGGNIRNIALNAAFLAAGNGGHVRMEHIICATKREFQKTGKLCVKADFEQYFEYVEREEEEVSL
ncbi:MAG TPA: AAA family ATPase [Pyrinomonadaceae bacterium]|jgi:SpoVK/Ycf46/Vps4 family AAA+-type ATPase